jgi:hypothetical protein
MSDFLLPSNPMANIDEAFKLSLTNVKWTGSDRIKFIVDNRSPASLQKFMSQPRASYGLSDRSFTCSVTRTVHGISSNRAGGAT